ncbi:MAG: sigma-54-dependent Fis family transcriptional regulator [Methylobacterium sp.]|nr:sigma-54-dependent Fis family transcriptional regulator [Methylobacterium sp.]
MTLRKRILAVDDEPNMRRLLEIMLKQAGYQPLVAANGREALDILKREGADLVVSDLHMPGMDGLGLLTAMTAEEIATPVIIVTAYGEVSSAVAAMKLGAADYIVRPFDLETLEIAMSRALSLARLKTENQFLRHASERGLSEMIGTSVAMQQVHQAIRQVAPEKATVLIAGETGTGKELAAHALHQLSPRSEALFVAVNCAAIPAEMMESELFGHERGAFTGAVKERIGKFELADGGTLFLDEITEMPIGLQAKLLRALQEGVIERLGGNRTISVDLRVVAATNRDPQQAIRDGKLREDLYYRLNVFRLDLPPLRQRPEDIPLLARHFAARRGVEISSDGLEKLAAYAWPGNVRELENVLERAAIVCGGNQIEASHLPLDVAVAAAGSGKPETPAAPANLSIPQATEALERHLIALALQQTGDNKSKAARLLEISERSLWYKLERYQRSNPSS